MKVQKAIKLLLSLVIGLFIVSCYGGSEVPTKTAKKDSTTSSTGTTTTTTVSAVDSPELVREVRKVIDNVDSGVSNSEQVQELEKELGELRDKVKSPELTKKIDAAIAKLKVELLALQSELEMKNNILTAVKGATQLIVEISKIDIKTTTKDGVEKTVNTLQKYLEQIEYVKSGLQQLIDAAGKKSGYEEEIKQLKELLAQLESQVVALKSNLEKAIEAKKSLVSADEVKAEMKAKIETMKKEIGKFLANVSIEADSEKINLLTSLISSISNADSQASLQSIQSKLQELERYTRGLITYLKNSKSELEALKLKVQNLYQEAKALGAEEADVLKNYLYSLGEVQLDTLLSKMEKHFQSIFEAYKSIALKERDLKEKAVKDALQSEYTKLAQEVNNQSSSIETLIKDLTALLAQKSQIEAKISAGTVTAEDIETLKAIKTKLSDVKVGDIYGVAQSLESQVAALKERSGSYLPEIGNLYEKISGYLKSLETLKKDSNTAKVSITQIIKDAENVLNKGAEAEAKAKAEAEAQVKVEELLSEKVTVAEASKKLEELNDDSNTSYCATDSSMSKRFERINKIYNFFISKIKERMDKSSSKRYKVQLQVFVKFIEMRQKIFMARLKAKCLKERKNPNSRKQWGKRK